MFSHGLRTALTALVLCGGILYGLRFYNQQIEAESGRQKVLFLADNGFWRGETSRSREGYLTTDNHLPLRAIARRPNVPLFTDENTGPNSSIRAVMRPWTPYYVYGYAPSSGVLNVSRRANAGPADLLRVLERDVYCWPTRETINIERGLPIYATLEDAQSQTNPIHPSYRFSYEDHFLPFGMERASWRELPGMAALPIIRREEGVFWSFIRPDPDPDAGSDRPYAVAWLRWDATDAGVSVRVRVTRRELAEFMNGINQLLLDYRGSADSRLSARRGLVAESQRMITGEEDIDRVLGFSNSQLDSRNDGIPMLRGLLQKPIQSTLEYQQLADRLADLGKLDSNRAAWDTDDLAYFDVNLLP